MTVMLAGVLLTGAALAATFSQDGLAGIVAPGATPELVQAGFQFTEGPVASSDGTLYFSDIPANRIHRLGSDGKIVVFREQSNGANGLAFDKNGRMLAAEGTGARVVVISADGKNASSLASSFGEQKFQRPNDLIPDAKGGVYFTDPGARPGVGQPVTRKPAVYYRKPDGGVILITDDITRPNGIILSLDAKTLLIADSMGEDVIAYDVQPDGSVKNRHTFARVREVRKSDAGTQSGADGMAIDREGRLYVTALNGIQVFNTKGEYLGVIAVPNKPSNLAFGGADKKTLYITAGDSVFRLQMATAGPEGRAK